MKTELVVTPRKKTWSKTYETHYGLCGNLRKDFVERDRSKQMASILNYTTVPVDPIDKDNRYQLIIK